MIRTRARMRITDHGRRQYRPSDPQMHRLMNSQVGHRWLGIRPRVSGRCCLSSPVAGAMLLSLSSRLIDNRGRSIGEPMLVAPGEVGAVNKHETTLLFGTRPSGASLNSRVDTGAIKVFWRLQTLERLESWTRSTHHRRGTRPN